MTNLDIAVMQLDGLIAGLEMKSEIPIQVSELKMLMALIQSEQPKKEAK